MVKSRLSGTRFKVKISGTGRSMRFLPEIDTSNFGGPPQSAILRIAGTEMYFLSILEMQLPRCGGITLNELLSIWEIIYSLAQELRGLLPSDTGPQNLNELEKFAPLLPKGALASLLADCTNLKYGTCTNVLDFLTFSKKNPDELWARPFVQHDEVFITPVINCITSANPTRMIEQWMKLGGIDLVARGAEFERHCRREAADSIGSNKLLINSGVLAAAHRFKKVKDNPGDIDIVLWIGHSIIVGEIKCNLFPSKPSEKSRHLEEMASAAKQIQRKAAALRKTAVEFYRSLTGKAPTEELKVIPFVLTNLTFGAGIRFDEVPVVDLLILNKYLRDGSMEKFQLVDDKSKESGGYRIYFYESEPEAEQRIEIYLTDPPQLWHFHDSIVPQENPIEPLKAGDVRWIARDYQIAIDAQALLKSDLEGMSNSRFNYRMKQL